MPRAANQRVHNNKAISAAKKNDPVMQINPLPTCGVVVPAIFWSEEVGSV